MKKSFCAKIVAIIAMVVIMLAGNSAYAWVGDGYTIDIPSTYTYGGSNAWTNATSKATLNIQILDNTSGEKVSYTTLQQSVDSLKSSYPGIIIDKSEVTKLNGMDALHIVSFMSSMFMEQYAVTTSSKVYVITMGATEKSYLSSSEATAIFSSFKVTGATTGTSTGTGTTGDNNTTNNVTNNTSDDNKITNTDDDDDDENKTTKKKSSKDDDDDEESNTWIIVAIVAGVIVFALIAIIIIVAIVVSGKKKQQY